MRMAFCLFGDPILVCRRFRSFLLPMLEYCSPVCMSAAVSHLRLLDHLVSKAIRLNDGHVVCDLEHKRRVGVLRMFYKIRCNLNHAVESAASDVHAPVRLIRMLFLFIPCIFIIQDRAQFSMRRAI